MKISQKLALIFLLVAIIPLTIVSEITLHKSASQIKEELILLNQQDIERQTDEFLEEIDESVTITKILVQTPPIQGLNRSKETGIDPLDGSTYNSWEQRLKTIFSEYIKNTPSIEQLRLIDNSGQETLRVNNQNGTPFIVPPQQLQDKSDRPYFQQTIQLQKDQVYISPIDLNVEYNEIIKPVVPTIRVGTPIYDENDNLTGILIANFRFFTQVEKTFSQEGIEDQILINQDGNYLIHPDSSKEFNHILNNTPGYFDLHPDLAAQMQASQDPEVQIDKDTSEIRLWQKIPYSQDPERYWILLHVIGEDELFQAINEARVFSNFTLIIAGVIVFILALIITRSMITKRLEKLASYVQTKPQTPQSTAEIQEIKQGNDEISTLSENFLKYLETSQTSAKKLEQSSLSNQEKLLIEEDRFKQAFDNSTIGMAIVSLKGHWLQINQALCDMLGYSREELTTKTFQDITYPEDLQKDLGLLNQLIKGEIPNYRLKKRYIKKNGDTIWITLSVSLVKDSLGKPLYFVSQIDPVRE